MSRIVNKNWHRGKKKKEEAKEQKGEKPSKRASGFTKQ